MDIKHLRTFVSVVEQGTVSKAALRLRVAQSALSRQISEFEREIGLTLFDRVGRRLVLTTVGEQLMGECRALLAHAGSLAERMERLRRGDSGVLKIATSPQMIEGVLSTFLHRYAERFPNIQIKLAEAVGPKLLSMLECGDAHVGISLAQAIRVDAHTFASFPLPQLEFLAAFRPSPQLRLADTIDIADLVALPLLVLDSNFVVRNTFDAACRLAGAKPNIHFESSSPHVLLSLAEDGHGVAVIPSVQPTHRYALQILRVTFRREPLREPLAILWDKRRAPPRYAEQLFEDLAEYMREAFPISYPRNSSRRERKIRRARLPINRGKVHP